MYEEAIKELTPKDWEWFSKDVLFHLGFNILIGPSEGADEGLDLVAERDNVKYLVSCKHKYKTRKSVGVREEVDIRDRMEQHDCQGFLAFYSTGATTGLKKKLLALKENKYQVIEIYRSDVFDIIPTMMGFVLQKYFSRPQDLHHHVVKHTEYKPLLCMGNKCNKDILEQKNISVSMAGFHLDEKELHLIYGCKHCVGDYINGEWAEVGQIRYIEQLLGWRAEIDDKFNDDYSPSKEFHEHWSLLQEAMLQIQIPQGWGRWATWC